jgi:hypothetical protein
LKRFYRGLKGKIRKLKSEQFFRANHPKLRHKISDLNSFEAKIYSSTGVDGIIYALLQKIGIINNFCVEFGVGDGRECNTRYLIEKGWDYLHMDGQENAFTYTRINKEYINAENINSLFVKYGVPKEFDILSIDLDYNTYWVWEAIDGYRPRIVIIEYNASIPPEESKVVKYDPNEFWDGTNYFGASLLALKKLGDKKGYTLVGCDSSGSDAIFVLSDLASEHFVLKDIDEIYKKPQYGVFTNGKFTGHPPSQREFLNI